jgi:hypothetical protein
MAAITDPVVVNFLSDIRDFASSYVSLHERALRISNQYTGGAMQSKLTGTQNADTIGDTQATKAHLMNVMTRVGEVVAEFGGSDIAKLHTLLALIESAKAPAP